MNDDDTSHTSRLESTGSVFEGDSISHADHTSDSTTSSKSAQKRRTTRGRPRKRKSSENEVMNWKGHGGRGHQMVATKIKMEFYTQCLHL